LFLRDITQHRNLPPKIIFLSCAVSQDNWKHPFSSASQPAFTTIVRGVLHPNTQVFSFAPISALLFSVGPAAKGHGGGGLIDEAAGVLHSIFHAILSTFSVQCPAWTLGFSYVSVHQGRDEFFALIASITIGGRIC
jgi:hypothetical protein